MKLAEPSLAEPRAHVTYSIGYRLSQLSAVSAVFGGDDLATYFALPET